MAADDAFEQYATVIELPVDEWDPAVDEDGDDSLLADGPVETRSARPQKKTKKPRRVVVPRKRVVRLGTVGNDAIAVKRALQRGGYLAKPRSGKPTRIFGLLAVRALRKWEKAHGLPVDGTYGYTDHRSFLNHRLYDAYGAWLMAHVNLKTPEQKTREGVVAAALWARAHEPHIHYSQGASRMSWVRHGHKQIPDYASHHDEVEDCSSLATGDYYPGGGPDPNGRGFDGEGFTGTQIQHGHAVSSISAALPADLVFYGRDGNGNPTHVAVYIGGGKVVSHGSENGPLVLPHDYRHDRHSIRTYIGGTP